MTANDYIKGNDDIVQEDSLGPARGVINGLIASIAFWGIVLTLIILFMKLIK